MLGMGGKHVCLCGILERIGSACHFCRQAIWPQAQKMEKSEKTLFAICGLFGGWENVYGAVSVSVSVCLRS